MLVFEHTNIICMIVRLCLQDSMVFDGWWCTVEAARGVASLTVRSTTSWGCAAHIAHLSRLSHWHRVHTMVLTNLNDWACILRSHISLCLSIVILMHVNYMFIWNFVWLAIMLSMVLRHRNCIDLKILVHERKFYVYTMIHTMFVWWFLLVSMTTDTCIQNSNSVASFVRFIWLHMSCGMCRFLSIFTFQY
jgi:hypothetical protein